MTSSNFIVVFCIGISAFTAFLNAFRQPVSVLAVVAGAFPKGATFFVSWSLLIVGKDIPSFIISSLSKLTFVIYLGLQHGLEIALFGISWINHSSYVSPIDSRRMQSVLTSFFSIESANTSLPGSEKLTRFPDSSVGRIGSLN